MPPGATSALLSDLLLAGSTLRPHAAGKLSTSFVNSTCEDGFKCVSQVELFGLGHDGLYKGLPLGVKLPPQYKSAYEWGCPARGTMSSSGECVQGDTKDATKLCWSTTRMESGKGSPCKEVDNCKCIKASENGNTALNNEYAKINEGKEIRTQKYLVQPKQQCDKCSDHDCNPAQCNRCEFCEYTTKTMANRKSEGCYDRAAPKPVGKGGKKENGRPYLDGDDATENDLIVIPHYPMWDPGATRDVTEPAVDSSSPSSLLRLPYQSRNEPLSKEAWINKYVEAAPRIQRLMDAGRENLVNAGNEASQIDCKADIPGRIRNFKSQRRECRHMQEISAQLAPHKEFQDETPDFSGQVNEINELKCQKVKGGKCTDLNCYFDDKEVTKAIFDLNERNNICKPERAQLERTQQAEAALLTKALPGGAKAGTSADGTSKTGGATTASIMPLPATLLLTLPAPTSSLPVPVESERRGRRRAKLRDFLWSCE